jgi:hypothetical protein
MPKPSIANELGTSNEPTEESTSYEAWFRECVQASIDDPRPSLSDADVRREFAKRRAELIQRIDRLNRRR